MNPKAPVGFPDGFQLHWVPAAPYCGALVLKQAWPACYLGIIGSGLLPPALEAQIRRKKSKGGKKLWIKKRYFSGYWKSFVGQFSPSVNSLSTFVSCVCILQASGAEMSSDTRLSHMPSLFLVWNIYFISPYHFMFLLKMPSKIHPS